MSAQDQNANRFTLLRALPMQVLPNKKSSKRKAGNKTAVKYKVSMAAEAFPEGVPSGYEDDSDGWEKVVASKKKKNQKKDKKEYLGLIENSGEDGIAATQGGNAVQAADEVACESSPSASGDSNICTLVTKPDTVSASDECFSSDRPLPDPQRASESKHKEPSTSDERVFFHGFFAIPRQALEPKYEEDTSSNIDPPAKTSPEDSVGEGAPQAYKAAASEETQATPDSAPPTSRDTKDPVLAQGQHFPKMAERKTKPRKRKARNSVAKNLNVTESVTSSRTTDARKIAVTAVVIGLYSCAVMWMLYRRGWVDTL